MKNILLVLLFAFSVPALASETKAAAPVPMKAPVNTDGYAEKTP